MPSAGYSPREYTISATHIDSVSAPKSASFPSHLLLDTVKFCDPTLWIHMLKKLRKHVFDMQITSCICDFNALIRLRFASQIGTSSTSFASRYGEVLRSNAMDQYAKTIAKTCLRHVNHLVNLRFQSPNSAPLQHPTRHHFHLTCY